VLVGNSVEITMKRKSSSKRKSKKRITSLLRKDPFDDGIDYTDLHTIASLAKLDPENALIQIECAKSLAPFEFARAKKYFQKSLTLEPKNASFHFHYAEALRLSKRNGQEFYNEAYRIEPNNVDHILGYMRKFFNRYWVWSKTDIRENLTAKALAIDPNHPLVNYFAANLSIHRRSWDSNIMVYSERVQKAFPHAKLALKGASSLPKEDEALMHDVVACVYAKEKRFRSAFRHYDKALVCEPLQGSRNYWRFLKKSKIEPELLKVVEGSLAKNFELREGRNVADLFKMYAILTPGFRALLKKNSSSTYLFLEEFARRERKWMLTIYPFNSDFFPKTVTMEILDFLFFL